jgi:hypothetical protein
MRSHHLRRLDPHFQEPDQPQTEVPENGNLDAIVNGIRVEVPIKDDYPVQRISEA